MWITITSCEYATGIETDYGPVSAGVVNGTTKKYQTEEIENVTKRIFDSPKNKHLMDVYHTMQPGETYDFKSVKNAAGKWALAEIIKIQGRSTSAATKPTDTTTGSTTTIASATYKKGMDSVGARVGNALNVAAKTVAQGKTIKSVILCACEALLESERLYKALESGTLEILYTTLKKEVSDDTNYAQTDTNNQYRSVEFEDLDDFPN